MEPTAAQININKLNESVINPVFSLLHSSFHNIPSFIGKGHRKLRDKSIHAILADKVAALTLVSIGK